MLDTAAGDAAIPGPIAVDDDDGLDTTLRMTTSKITAATATATMIEMTIIRSSSVEHQFNNLTVDKM